MSEKPELTAQEILWVKRKYAETLGFTPNEIVACVKFLGTDGAMCSKFPSLEFLKNLEKSKVIEIISIG